MIDEANAAAQTAFSAWPLLLLTLTVLGGVGAALARPWWVARRRARLRALPFPATWRRILRQRVPVVARLPADLQQRLKGHIQVFIAEKPFIACGGQAIGDEQRVTIAAQACLLLLGQARPEVYPGLREVLVYPGAFVVDAAQAASGGVVHERRQVLAGQSWSQGRVILAWDEVRAGAADADDGRNVVVHEFAHQIDQDKGVADGRPWRASRAQRRRWDAVVGAAFSRLQVDRLQADHLQARHLQADHLQADRSGGFAALVGDYGASDPAEFFAVLSELFFERPQALAAEAPAVYRELALLYQVHPAAW